MDGWQDREAGIREFDQLTRLLEEHGHGLYALLFKLTRSHDVADDLFQELFARLGRSTSWLTADDPAGYAYRSARNLAFEFRRKNKRIQPIAAGCAIEREATQVPASDLMVQAEERDALLDALARLDEPWRTALTMRYLQERAYDEIAQQLGKQTQAQARSVVQKGLVKLRAIIEKGSR